MVAAFTQIMKWCLFKTPMIIGLVLYGGAVNAATPIIEFGQWRDESGVWVIDVNIQRWAYSENNNAISCLRVNCWVGVGAYDLINSAPISRGEVMAKVSKRTADVTTSNQLEDDVLNSGIFPMSGTIRLRPPAKVESVCLGVGTGTDFGGLGWSGQMACDVLPQPPKPEPELKCEIIGDITLDHGVVKTSEINGHRVEDFATINCNSKANFYLYLQGGGGDIFLTKDKALFSSLSINDESIGSGVNVSHPGGSVNMKLTSTLKSNGADIGGGEFSGVGIVVIEVK